MFSWDSGAPPLSLKSTVYNSEKYLGTLLIKNRNSNGVCLEDKENLYRHYRLSGLKKHQVVPHPFKSILTGEHEPHHRGFYMRLSASAVFSGMHKPLRPSLQHMPCVTQGLAAFLFGMSWVGA